MSIVNLIKHSYSSVDETVPGVPVESQKVIFSDPPYNIRVKYADDPTRDRLEPRHYESWCDSTIYTLSRHLAPGGTFWWLCPVAHLDFIPAILRKHVGERLYTIIKEESFAQYQQGTLTEDFRFLFCYQKAGPLTFNPDAIRIMSDRQEMGDKRADPRGRVPGQMWKIRRLQGTATARVDWHPAQLAPELLRRIVLGWSNPGDPVMDGFLGSGSMAMVAREEGRDFVGVDQSPTYLANVRERMKIDEHGHSIFDRQAERGVSLGNREEAPVG